MLFFSCLQLFFFLNWTFQIIWMPAQIIWQRLDCWQVGCCSGNFKLDKKKKIKSIYKTQNGQTDYSLAGKPYPLEAVDQALSLAASLLEYRWKNWLPKHFSRPQLSRRRDPKRCWRIFPWQLIFYLSVPFHCRSSISFP